MSASKSATYNSGHPFNFTDHKHKGFTNDEHMYMPSMMKKGPRGAPHPNPYKLDQFDMEDSSADYVFVGFNKKYARGIRTV